MVIIAMDFSFELNGQALESVLPVLNLATGLNGAYEIRGRFVEQHEFRLGSKRPSDADQLALAVLLDFGDDAQLGGDDAPDVRGLEVE